MVEIWQGSRYDHCCEDIMKDLAHKSILSGSSCRATAADAAAVAAADAAAASDAAAAEAAAPCLGWRQRAHCGCSASLQSDMLHGPWHCRICKPCVLSAGMGH